MEHREVLAITSLLLFYGKFTSDKVPTLLKPALFFDLLPFIWFVVNDFLFPDVGKFQGFVQRLLSDFLNSRLLGLKRSFFAREVDGLLFTVFVALKHAKLYTHDRLLHIDLLF